MGDNYLFIFKQKKHRSSASSLKENPKHSPPEDIVSEDAFKTIYVSDLKDSTTTDAITYFFENKKRTGGGDLCEGKEGFKRLSPTVARLTFVSSQGIVLVIVFISVIHTYVQLHYTKCNGNVIFPLLSCKSFRKFKSIFLFILCNTILFQRSYLFHYSILSFISYLFPSIERRETSKALYSRTVKNNQNRQTIQPL